MASGFSGWKYPIPIPLVPDKCAVRTAEDEKVDNEKGVERSHAKHDERPMIMATFAGSKEEFGSRRHWMEIIGHQDSCRDAEVEECQPQSLDNNILTEEIEELRIDESTPDWIRSNKYVRFSQRFLGINFIPVLTVSEQPELKEGDMFSLFVLEPWPSRKHVKPLLFEMAKTKNDYVKMEVDMRDHYTALDNRAPFPRERLEPGHHLVFFDRLGTNGKFIYKRAVVRGAAISDGILDAKNKEPEYRVSIRLIDYGFELSALCSDLLFMDKQFSTLPPRAYQFLLDGMIRYKSLRIYDQILNPESGIFDGELLVILRDRTTMRIVIYTRQFQQVDTVFGLNGFAIQRMASELNKCWLPETGNERGDAYVVHASTCAEVWIQFDTPFFKHYNDLLKLCTPEKIKESKGKVRFPQDEGAVLMAPHVKSDGTYYRCKYLDISSAGEIDVRFIDYGDHATVYIHSVFLAEEIHPAFGLIPELAVSVRLSGITNMNLDSFWKVVFPEKPVVVFTCENNPKTKPVVELRLYFQKEKQLFQEVIIGHNGHRGLISKQVKPFERSMVSLPQDTGLRSIPREQIIWKDICNSNFYRPGRIMFISVLSGTDKDGTVLVIPAVLHDRLKNLETLLKTAYDYTKKWRDSASTYHKCWQKGQMFMTHSFKFGSIVRCMLMETPTAKKPKVNVFLVDYGDVDSVQVQALKVLKEEHCFLPAAGCRATLRVKGTLPDCSSKELLEVLDYRAFEGEIISIERKGGIPTAVVEIIRAINEKDIYKDVFRPFISTKST